MERLEAQHEETLRREAGLLNTARPDWANQTYATEAREKISAFAKRYGFSKAEIAGLNDHRMVLFAQDFAALSERYEALKSGAKRVDPATDKRLGRETAAVPRHMEQNRRRAPSRAELAQRVAGIMAKR